MKSITKEDVKKFCDTYLKYKSLKKVSKTYGHSPNTIKKYISKFVKVNKQNIVKKVVTEDERLIGAYVGIWLGDGTQYYDRGFTVKICCNKKDIIANKFIQELFCKVFGKKTNLLIEHETNRAYIKLRSKFIFDFISRYVTYKKGKKNYSAHLKEGVNNYSSEFIEGCLLGLILSDGYLKEKLVFRVTSKNLARNMFDILKLFALKPSFYAVDRTAYGWKDIYVVYLTKKDSTKLIDVLDAALKEMNYLHSFRELKYGPPEI